jgi:methylenetetrahydrofolate dehydrogenase (NADP+) / methenyltetrahydrofolate cyclohydrolase
MPATLIDGNAIARSERARLKSRADALIALGITPGLAVVLVGEDPASKVYVRNKARACGELGLHSAVIELPAAMPQQGLLEQIARLNADASIHGILVQLPLPKHIDAAVVVEAIALHKDVDGFSLHNLGGLVAGRAQFPPCTPFGVMRMLEHHSIPLSGQNAVVVGRSNIVGKPMALMLLAKDATVSICTSKTRDLTQHTLLADVLVVAAGKPKLITAAMVKPGAVVIDVGTNRAADGRLVGDVDFESVREVAGYISPVPGGVGPMTITMLLANTIQAAEQANEAAV